MTKKKLMIKITGNANPKNASIQKLSGEIYLEEIANSKQSIEI
jgi:hypothetical protein